MIVETVSGSKYEVDMPGRRARRLSSEKTQTGRTPCGVWRKFSRFHPQNGPTPGQPMMFEWADQAVGAPAAEACSPGTITTAVYLLDVGPDV